MWQATGLSSSFTLMNTLRASPPGGAMRRPTREPASLLPKARANVSAIPITSPVDRISGPRIVSTPGNFANGKTLSFTETCRGTAMSSTPSSSSVLPTMTLAAIFASGRPVAFETNGTVRLARGFTSRM